MKSYHYSTCRNTRRKRFTHFVLQQIFYAHIGVFIDISCINSIFGIVSHFPQLTEPHSIWAMLMYQFIQFIHSSSPPLLKPIAFNAFLISALLLSSSSIFFTLSMIPTTNLRKGSYSRKAVSSSAFPWAISLSF